MGNGIYRIKLIDQIYYQVNACDTDLAFEVDFLSYGCLNMYAKSYDTSPSSGFLCSINAKIWFLFPLRKKIPLFSLRSKTCQNVNAVQMCLQLIKASKINQSS